MGLVFLLFCANLIYFFLRPSFGYQEDGRINIAYDVLYSVVLIVIGVALVYFFAKCLLLLIGGLRRIWLVWVCAVVAVLSNLYSGNDIVKGVFGIDVQYGCGVNNFSPMIEWACSRFLYQIAGLVINFIGIFFLPYFLLYLSILLVGRKA